MRLPPIPVNFQPPDSDAADRADGASHAAFTMYRAHEFLGIQP